MPMEASALVRKTRLRLRLTQSELADRLGKTQATVASLERPGANPTLNTLEETLHAMGHNLELQAVPGPPSVDETLVARNLRLSPAQRLSAFETAHRDVESLRRSMRGR
jgi:transcriptional regulator with XRE-family HTH domain